MSQKGKPSSSDSLRIRGKYCFWTARRCNFPSSRVELTNRTHHRNINRLRLYLNSHKSCWPPTSSTPTLIPPTTSCSSPSSATRPSSSAEESTTPLSTPPKKPFSSEFPLSQANSHKPVESEVGTLSLATSSRNWPACGRNDIVTWGSFSKLASWATSSFSEAGEKTKSFSAHVNSTASRKKSGDKSLP